MINRKLCQFVFFTFVVYSYIYCVIFVLVYKVLFYFFASNSLDINRVIWEVLTGPFYIMELEGLPYLLLLLPLVYLGLLKINFLDRYTTFVVSVIGIAILSYLSMLYLGIEAVDREIGVYFIVNKVYLITPSLLIALLGVRLLFFKKDI